jgi:hypothetical protein
MHNPIKDSMTAARMIAVTLGHKTAKPGESLDEDACIRRAEVIMKRSVEQVAVWLRDLSRDDPYFRVVMFVVSGGRRIGVCVMIPLGEAAFAKLSKGEIHDSDITPEDLDPAPRAVFAFAMSDSEGVPDLTPREKTLAQARSVYYQMAYFTRRQKPYRPTLITVVSNPQYRAMLQRLGGVETGTYLRGTDLPLLILEHPRDRTRLSIKTWIPYRLFALTLNIFRLANRSEWRKEDRLRSHAAE